MAAEAKKSRTKLSQRKSTGAHYTPQALASFVATQILSTVRLHERCQIMRILDPAVGDGELLDAFLRQINPSVLGRVVVDGFDTDAKALTTAKTRLFKAFPNTIINLSNENFLAVARDHYLSSQGGLFAPTRPFYDAIIANPPYVRTQVMGATESQRLSKLFGLRGRLDLYHAFLEAIAHLLRPEGIAGVICSNRFMTTRSGVNVRQSLAENFDIIHIWDLGDTRMFDAAVLPAVLLLRKKGLLSGDISSRFSSIYSARAQAKIRADSPLEALSHTGFVEVKGQIFNVRHGYLNSLDKPLDVWALSNSESDNWLEQVSDHTFRTFGELGKIRVGVKTTADKVFIRSDWDTFTPGRNPELLKPLITHTVVKRFRVPSYAACPKILYTHHTIAGKRKVIDLDFYPNSRRYLNEHREALESRNYIVEAGRQWYEIWVPQNPDAWKRPKLVFPDISELPTFCMDLGGAVVNGDCYWIAAAKDSDLDVLWLALAVGNSTFIEEFYDHKFNNKLYAGRRRFMTQYVEQFPLPDPDSDLSREIILKTKNLFNQLSSHVQSPKHLVCELNELVWRSFGFNLEEISRKPNLELLV